jgi:hypothetical protein
MAVAVSKVTAATAGSDVSDSCVEDVATASGRRSPQSVGLRQPRGAVVSCV